ncbi:MAG: glucose-1-phosphate cytidylyltransferase [bacterium]
MKVVILAGGFGTRISEESIWKPKPMIEIGDKPILWHIMKMYGYYGYNEFIICCGYKQHVIKEWFADYYLHNSDITFDFTEQENRMIVHNNYLEPWKVTLVDTGLRTMTGGRVRRVRPYIGDETFFLTYGDAVADINVPDLLAFHKKGGRMATITTVQPPGRFGILDIDTDGGISNFREKKKDGGWVNAGYMVFEPSIFELLRDDETILERYPLAEAARTGQLNGYRHRGFWQCMDTLREKNLLEGLWADGSAPWKIWD